MMRQGAPKMKKGAVSAGKRAAELLTYILDGVMICCVRRKRDVCRLSCTHGI